MPVAIDLHCHSTFSDGALSPEALVAYAAERGVKVLALTDHDEVGGLARARQAAQQHGITLINGVEISVTWKKRTIHVVGLRIDAENAAMRQVFEGVRLAREARAFEMSQGLAKVGFADVYAGAKALAGNSILTRSHLAQYLVNAGHVKNVKTVFKKYLVKGKPGFVDHEWMALPEAIHLIQQSGGVAVLAHPGRYDLGMINLHLLLNEFRDCGGVGIEVVTGSHQPPQFVQFAKLAHRFGLKASQGSDYHGPGMSFIGMGQLPDLPHGCEPLWRDWPEADFLQ